MSEADHGENTLAEARRYIEDLALFEGGTFSVPAESAAVLLSEQKERLAAASQAANKAEAVTPARAEVVEGTPDSSGGQPFFLFA